MLFASVPSVHGQGGCGAPGLVLGSEPKCGPSEHDKWLVERSGPWRTEVRFAFPSQTTLQTDMRWRPVVFEHVELDGTTGRASTGLRFPSRFAFRSDLPRA